MYDITIAYRIYPGVSKTPFVFPDNKLALTELGVKTIKKSLGKMRAKFFFLLDNCPADYQEMISSYFDKEDVEFLGYSGIGNLATFGKQIEILLTQTDSEIIMFAEDDYVYRQNELEKAILLLKRKNSRVDFVTPYDHLDSYLLPIHTRHKYEIIAEEGLHWRTSASTCLTFLTKKTILSDTKEVMKSYCFGNWDSSLWYALTKYNVGPSFFGLLFQDIFLFKTSVKSWIYGWRQILFGKKYKLWQPIPSIATHMEKISLAPAIDWNAVVDGFKNKE